METAAIAAEDCDRAEGILEWRSKLEGNGNTYKAPNPNWDRMDLEISYQSSRRAWCEAGHGPLDLDKVGWCVLWDGESSKPSPVCSKPSTDGW